MPTIQEGPPPTAAKPAAAPSAGSAPAPLVMNATEIVNAAINNSVNVHISNATSMAETAEPSIALNSASTDGGEASASTGPTELSKEAKKAETERRRKQRQDEKNAQQQFFEHILSFLL